MEFVNIKEKSTYYLVDCQHKDMWEEGYLTVCKIGSDVISFMKMEELIPVYIQENLFHEEL